MYWTPEEGSTAGRELSFDDVDAICAAYPPEGSGPGADCAPFPREFTADCQQRTPGTAPDAPTRDDGGCSVTPRPSREAFGPLALAGVAAAIFVSRRRALRRP